MKIPIEVSARHIHLSRNDADKLFGPGYELTVKNTLSQPDEFAAEESLRLIGSRGELKARIIGPLRTYTQIEISLTDARALGIATVLRPSGSIAGSAGIRLAGTVGEISIPEGVIIAQRHLHASHADAAAFNLHDQQIISVTIPGPRGGRLDNIIVRVAENFKLALHIDTDEANALGVNANNSNAELIPG